MLKRHITSSLLQALSDTPIILLNGARQTGKSTLTRQLISKTYPAQYITLDDIDVLNAARVDPVSFINNFNGPVIIDEIQRAPELFLPLKANIDRNRKPGRFLLTGSANVLLLPRLADSLAGRLEILTLQPLSQGEIEGVQETFIDRMFSSTTALKLKQNKALDIAVIIKKICKGGYPEMLTRETSVRQNAWFNSYLTTLIQRDARILSNIEGINDLPKLLTLLATRTASLLNFAELSRSSQTPQTTLKRYMALLEGLFLIEHLPAWANNLSKRLVKAPKVMLNDTGLLSYLLKLNPEHLINNHHLLSPIVENFIVTELRKQNTWNETQVQFFHFRSQTGHEVDLLMEDGRGKIIGIEIKAKTTLSTNDFKGLQTLAELLGKRLHRGLIIYLGKNSTAFGKNLWTVPISELWAA